MPRHREGLKRKQTYGVSLHEEEFEALSTIGGGSLTAGVSWLIETILERDPDNPGFKRVREVRAAFVRHQEEVTAAKKKAAADIAAARAAKKAAKGPTKAEREHAEAVEHYAGINAQRFARGEPLYDMSHLSRNPELVAAVYADAKAKYGWETGPRPPVVTAVTEQEPIKTQEAPAPEFVFGEPQRREPPAWVHSLDRAPGPDPGQPGSDELQESNTVDPDSAAPTENVQAEHSSVHHEHSFMQPGDNSMQPDDTRPNPAQSGPAGGDEGDTGDVGGQIQEPEF